MRMCARFRSVAMLGKSMGLDWGPSTADRRIKGSHMSSCFQVEALRTVLSTPYPALLNMTLLYRKLTFRRHRRTSPVEMRDSPDIDGRGRPRTRKWLGRQPRGPPRSPSPPGAVSSAHSQPEGSIPGHYVSGYLPTEGEPEDASEVGHERRDPGPEQRDSGPEQRDPEQPEYQSEDTDTLPPEPRIPTAPLPETPEVRSYVAYVDRDDNTSILTVATVSHSPEWGSAIIEPVLDEQTANPAQTASPARTNTAIPGNNVCDCTRLVIDLTILYQWILLARQFIQEFVRCPFYRKGLETSNRCTFR